MRKIKLSIDFKWPKTGLQIREIFKRIMEEDFYTEEVEITDMGVGSVIGVELQPEPDKQDWVPNRCYLTLALKPQGADFVFHDLIFYESAELVSWISEGISQEEYYEVLNSVPASDMLEICKRLKKKIESEFGKNR